MMTLLCTGAPPRIDPVGEWMEVVHMLNDGRDLHARANHKMEAMGLWLHHAPGSGLWYHTGRTITVSVPSE